MNTVEKVKAELKAQKIPVSKMERDLGFANGYLSQLKKGDIPTERLQKIAIYLNVDVFSLMDDKMHIVKGIPANYEGGNVVDVSADALISDLQLLRDRPDLRAMLHVGKRNTPEQIQKLMELMETMKEG